VPRLARYRSWLVFATTLCAGMAAGWVGLPAVLYERLPQPLAFDHVRHTTGAGLGCADCHELTAGRGQGLPRTAKCAECHAQAIGASAAEKRLVDEYVTPGREIPWLVHARQPDNVWFPHTPHAAAKVACERCHGARGASTKVEPFERNRLTGYSRDLWGHSPARLGRAPGDGMKMTDCIACHRRSHVEDACLDCHT